jgi:hypothetical protein
MGGPELAKGRVVQGFYLLVYSPVRKVSSYVYIR